MSDGSESTMAAELRDELDHMLEVLRKLARGALSVRVESRFDESHPVGALAAAFNDVAAALETTRAERQNFERQLEERLEVIERQRSAIHELGTPVEKDAVVREATKNPKTFQSIDVSRDGRFLIATVRHGWVKSEVFFQDLRAKKPS